MNSRGTEISCGVKVLYNLSKTKVGEDLYKLFWRSIEHEIKRNKTCREWYRNSPKEYLDMHWPINPLVVVKQKFLNTSYSMLPAHYVFSDNTKRKCGEALRDYIRKHKLGSVVSSDRAKNVNSGNTIQTFIWVVNKEAMVDWFIAEYNKRNNKTNKGAHKGDKRKKGSGRIPQVA